MTYKFLLLINLVTGFILKTQLIPFVISGYCKKMVKVNQNTIQQSKVCIIGTHKNFITKRI